MRAQAPEADLIVAGNHPWPGDPMQSFKVLLHHRAACRMGGVLVGLFWTDPDEIARSFPMPVLRVIATTGAAGGWTMRRMLPIAEWVTAAVGSPAAFMLRWARELVIDRTVLVYAPPLYQRVGPRLGPVRLFGEQTTLWQAAARARAQERCVAGRQSTRAPISRRRVDLHAPVGVILPREFQALFARRWPASFSRIEIGAFSGQTRLDRRTMKVCSTMY